MRHTERGALALAILGMILFVPANFGGPKALAIPGSALVGLAGAWSMLRAQRAGIFRTRRGLLYRRDHPGLFRFHVCCAWTALALWMLVGLLVGLGVLRTP